MRINGDKWGKIKLHRIAADDCIDTLPICSGRRYLKSDMEQFQSLSLQLVLTAAEVPVRRTVCMYVCTVQYMHDE